MTTSLRIHIAFLSVFSLSSLYFLLKSRRLRRLSLHSSPPLTSPKIFYLSETNTSKTLAHRLHSFLLSNSLQFELTEPSLYEPDRLFNENLLLFVVSTWQDGKPPTSSQYFSQFLADAASDFRVGSLALSGCKFAIFGVGSASYGDTFNAAARDFSKWLRALGAKELLPVWEGDVDTGDLDMGFDAWGVKVARVLKGEVEGEISTNGFDEELEEMVEIDEMEETGFGEVDIEDIAGKIPDKNSLQGLPKGGRNGENGVKEMVTPVIRSSLEKQVSFPSICFLLSDQFFVISMFPSNNPVSYVLGLNIW